MQKRWKIIIPTYVNNGNKDEHSLFIKLIGKAGAGFKGQFNYETYQEFFSKAGYSDVKYMIINGKMPCAIAIITK